MDVLRWYSIRTCLQIGTALLPTLSVAEQSELSFAGLPPWLLYSAVKRLEQQPTPNEITVINREDSGEGSLRDAISSASAGDNIKFDPGLAGGVINLDGAIVPAVDVKIDASAAPGLTLNGGGVDRLLIVNSGVSVTVIGMTFTNGFGFQLGGAILNNGELTLRRSTVGGNTMTTGDGQFWQGGGGIYNGDGSTLLLEDSTVSNNFSGWAGGGIFSFYNSTTIFVRSTISDNVAADIGGGFRALGDVVISNSTISNNVSTSWHGGAAFITDGTVEVTHSTVTGNTAPAGTTGGLFVGTFGDGNASMTIANSVVAANGDSNCFLGPFGSGAVSIDSLGGNVFTDASCDTFVSDQVVGNPLLGALGDNGGETRTHALLLGSPAIDAAEPAACLATDQRGVTRPQGAACDAGAFELQ